MQTVLEIFRDFAIKGCIIIIKEPLADCSIRNDKSEGVNVSRFGLLRAIKYYEIRSGNTSPTIEMTAEFCETCLLEQSQE